MTREIVFVANDVGGPGGMERQSEQLVSRLLAAGRPVIVIARSCTLPAQRGLRFRRVPTPRRPASLAYPAFFAIGSLMLAGRRPGLLHTTGAIVANRADVSTIHYCHRAAAGKVEFSRASRSSAAYRLNAIISGLLSRAGEMWCYRPRRTRLLCAVSRGVADELADHFPAMQGSVRAIPNGVDSRRFKPDPDARARVRSELGVSAADLVVLFAGGDWERKGLPLAVDALGAADGWDLVVAGPGDPEPLRARARDAGTEARLHFLGRVTDMPRVYASADAFVLPTTYEAFPLVVLEAAASGLPLLVTRVNGVEELLADEHAGWFITRNAEDISRRLNELRADPELARRMSLAARATIAGYSWQSMADAYLELYEELSHASRITPDLSGSRDAAA
jgi:glycosyltransferase involved in cell wall biosynthesis